MELFDVLKEVMADRILESDPNRKINITTAFMARLILEIYLTGKETIISYGKGPKTRLIVINAFDESWTIVRAKPGGFLDDDLEDKVYECLTKNDRDEQKAGEDISGVE